MCVSMYAYLLNFNLCVSVFCLFGVGFGVSPGGAQRLLLVLCSKENPRSAQDCNVLQSTET